MSRLEDLIHRFTVQKSHLDRAIALCKDIEGLVIEVGLGSGRSFDHLREKLNNNPIFTFDYRVETHPGCAPREEQCILGDIEETLPKFSNSRSGQAALIHMDIGTKKYDEDIVLYQKLTPAIIKLMAPKALLVSDRPISDQSLKELEPFGANHPWKYFSYQKNF